MSQSKIQSPMPDYFPAFDWLRLLLAMMVALSHGGLHLDPQMGNFAVQVFFALSGWLIGGILFDSEKSKLPRFYFNRATRIWGPYYFAVALVFAVSLLKEPLDAHWFEYLFYDVTYTHNWFITPRIAEIASDLPLQGTMNHFWSLSVEEQFYLFAPLLILFLKWGRSPWMWAAVAFLAVATGGFYGSIALGVLAVVLQRHFGDWFLKTPAVIALAVIAVASFAIYFTWSKTYIYVAPFASVAIVLLLARRGSQNPVGVFVGGISYPLYLNHWLGIFIANEIGQMLPFVSGLLKTAVGGAGNLVIASILYLAIDDQIRKRRNGWFTPGRGRLAAYAAYGLVFAGAAGGLLIAALRG